MYNKSRHFYFLYSIMNIGYARVSKDSQDLALQIDALKSYGCERIFTDQISGIKNERPGLQEALNFVRQGDAIVIWRLDRLGRSLSDLISLVENFNTAGIELISLTEQLSTKNSSGKLIFHLFGALAEFERNLIKERTLAGLKAARARGRIGGRPLKLTEQDKIEIQALASSGNITIQQIAHRYGVSRATIYNTLKITNPS